MNPKDWIARTAANLEHQETALAADAASADPDVREKVTHVLLLSRFALDRAVRLYLKQVLCAGYASEVAAGQNP